MNSIKLLLITVQSTVVNFIRSRTSTKSRQTAKNTISSGRDNAKSSEVGEKPPPSNFYIDKLEKNENKRQTP